MLSHNNKEELQMQIELMKIKIIKLKQIKKQTHKATNKEDEMLIVITMAFNNLQDQINSSMYFPIQI